MKEVSFYALLYKFSYKLLQFFHTSEMLRVEILSLYHKWTWSKTGLISWCHTKLFCFPSLFFFTLDWKGLQLSNIRECDVNNTPLTVCSVLVHDNDMYPNLCKFWSKSFHDINPVFMISLLFSWYHSCLLYVQCSYYEKVQLQMLLFSKTIHAVGWMENVTKIIRISL